VRKRLNVGIIGVSTWHGVVQHLEKYLSCPDAHVVAVCDPDADRAAQVAAEYGIERHFGDHRDLLALDEVDAVSIALPPDTHAALTCAAAAAGKHVLCEKAMALDHFQARQMADACRRAGVKLGLCQARIRFVPAIELAREYVMAGRLGRIYYVRSSRFRRRRPGIETENAEKWFLDSSRSGGGALMDLGCYDVDALLYLLGDLQPSTVSTFTFRGVSPEPPPTFTFDVEEHASVMVRCRNAPTITLETSWRANIDRGDGIVLFGTEGGLKVEPLDPQGFVFYRERDGMYAATSIDLPPPTADVVSDFVGACLEDRMPKTSPEEGVRTMQILTTAYESASRGIEVSVEEGRP
jgi:predicted dehydrogenase